jgi:hypothetical protein
MPRTPIPLAMTTTTSPLPGDAVVKYDQNQRPVPPQATKTKNKQENNKRRFNEINERIYKDWRRSVRKTQFLR